ncbi:hypothetical protein OPV22_032109 [Ensete ventricosum]|uniref:FLZ-type domain-containing protein n=1 Tax=Ensete ventricosum TaxID=4639 RepID=A0AAV8PXC2_ENSVE|nr:hypothetical protein OPV22_032109 [Ensete ventricosum]
MLLRKRPRPPMRRTTSMAEFAPNAVLPNDEAAQPSSECAKASDVLHHQREPQRPAELPAERRDAGPAGWLEARYQRVLNSSPGGGRNRRSSGDFSVVETAPFLRACGLCKRSLGPGRDTFMYRGDIAFCSHECRQQQMKQDERKAKCSLTSIKDAATATNGSEQAGKGETVAAA